MKPAPEMDWTQITIELIRFASIVVGGWYAVKAASRSNGPIINPVESQSIPKQIRETVSQRATSFSWKYFSWSWLWFLGIAALSSVYGLYENLSKTTLVTRSDVLNIAFSLSILLIFSVIFVAAYIVWRVQKDLE